MKKSSSSHQPPITAIGNAKGGVAKSTTAINLSVHTARKIEDVGGRVLVVDADYQCHTSNGLLHELPERTLFDSLIDESIPLTRIRVRPNLDLVPASPQMYGLGFSLIMDAVRAALEGITISDPRGILARLLSPVAQEYKYIYIDCPPSDSLMSINALYAATHVLIPTTPEPFALQGVSRYIKTIQKFNMDAHKNVQVAGILMTNIETGSVGHALGEKALREWAQRYVYDARIRHSRPLYNAALAHQDIFTFSPRSNGATDYSIFCEEFLIKLS